MKTEICSPPLPRCSRPCSSRPRRRPRSASSSSSPRRSTTTTRARPISTERVVSRNGAARAASASPPTCRPSTSQPSSRISGPAFAAHREAAPLGEIPGLGAFRSNPFNTVIAKLHDLPAADVEGWFEGALCCATGAGARCPARPTGSARA